MQLGSMFICNCNIAVHVSDAFCIHLQEHLEIVEAAFGEWHETGWVSNKASKVDGIHTKSYFVLYTPVSCHSPEAASTISKCSWRWTQNASETCRAILQLQINILPSCITLVLLYILLTLIWITIASRDSAVGTVNGLRAGDTWIVFRFPTGARGSRAGGFGIYRVVLRPPTQPTFNGCRKYIPGVKSVGVWSWFPIMHLVPRL